MKIHKKLLVATFIALSLGSLDLSARHESRDDRLDAADNDEYDLYDRNRDGIEFNQYDYPENAEDPRPNETTGANSVKLLR